ncbi:MAG TPA: hypothetical protein VJ914_02585 [Pseudonocardiaceae bacterium]|nr:hypothetical protein [Pseudonocardiaceae bacterium]
MAKSGSGRQGASGSANRGRNDGRKSGGAGNRPGQGGKGKNSNRTTAASAQRAIKGARQTSMLKGVVLPAAIVIIVAAAVVVGIVLSRGNKSNATAASPQQDTSSALLARTSTGLTGQDIDGVSSNDMEQVAFHIHAHLAIYVNGTQKLIPYGVGIVPPYQLQTIPAGSPGAGTSFVGGGSKFYWLHTHDETGVIHIESPKQVTFTLGQFFDEWGQQLSPTQVGSNTGKITAYVNGKVFTGNPRDIPLNAHNVIQLDLGKDVAPQPFTFPQGE